MQLTKRLRQIFFGHVRQTSSSRNILVREYLSPKPAPTTLPVSLRSGSSSVDSLSKTTSSDSQHGDLGNKHENSIVPSADVYASCPESPTEKPLIDFPTPRETPKTHPNSCERASPAPSHPSGTHLDRGQILPDGRTSSQLSPISEQPVTILPQKAMEESSIFPTPTADHTLAQSTDELTASDFPEAPADPDSFLIDDPEDPISDDEDVRPLPPTPSLPASMPEQPNAPAEEISLTQPSSDILASKLASPNINKAVPPPPLPDSDEDDDEVPDLYLPGLVIPTMFLPIPNTDPLTTLLTKYIFPPEKRPMRDVTGDWQHADFHTLVMTNSWRALARMARDRIVATSPESLPLILGLWYLRLACLSRLRLFNQTSAECTNLFSVLNSVGPPSAHAYLFNRLLPFELEVMHARLKYWAGDHMAYLDALYALLKKCRTQARLAKSDTSSVAMWKERGARLCLIIASQLVEMKEFTAAAKLLEPLCVQGQNISSPALRSAVARIYLQGGHIGEASDHFAAVSEDPNAEQPMKDMNAALLASAEGDWSEARALLTNLVSQDSENYAAVNNLSVALLSEGKLKEAIAVLESALASSPSSVVVAEPFLFNLSTLYELRSATAAENKRNLLIEVAKWSGDGLRTTCLKMPSN